MFLDQLMKLILSENARSILILIISQLNLLLCLVNDVLDIKLIDQGKYNSSSETFSPKSAIDFIVTMFHPLSQIQKTSVSSY